MLILILLMQPMLMPYALSPNPCMPPCTEAAVASLAMQACPPLTPQERPLTPGEMGCVLATGRYEPDARRSRDALLAEDSV